MRVAPTANLAFAGALAASFIALALQPQPLHAQAGGRERTMFVSAIDSRGEPVDGLGPDDFIIREDGQRREILRVSRAVEPIDIALLVDTSAAAENAVSSLRQALTSFVSLMAAENQIALVGLADRPTILTDYTSNRGLLEKGIGRVFAMSTSGMTLLDAIWEVSNGLRRREATRAVVVPVMTAGTEFSNRNARDVIGSLRDAGAGLHAIVVGVIDSTSVVDRERGQVLDEGTRTTGGQHVTLLTDTALDQALRKLARELTSQYKVVYGRPESLIPPERLEVVSGRTGVTMRGTPARGQTGA
jgi:VWFA-related protein